MAFFKATKLSLRNIDGFMSSLKHLLVSSAKPFCCFPKNMSMKHTYAFHVLTNDTHEQKID